MATKGNDLLSRYEEYKKKKKATEEVSASKNESTSTSGTQGSSLLERYHERNKYQAVDTSFVNQEYVNTFVTDAKDFLRGVGNNEVGFSDLSGRLEDLNKRHNNVSAWLYQNQSNIDKKSYSELSNNLGQFKGVFDRLGGFASEKDYKQSLGAWKADQEKYTYDLQAGQAEIDNLQNILSEYYNLNGQLNAAKRSHASEQKKASIQKQMDALVKQYGGVEGLSSLLSEKQAYHTVAGRAQRGVEMSSVSNPEADNYDERFGEYSAANRDYSSDKTYRYINNIDSFQATESSYWATHGTYTSDNGGVYNVIKPQYIDNHYNLMDESEKALYNYYYELDRQNGTNLSGEYLGLIQETLNRRKGQGTFETMENQPLLEMVFGVAAGLDQFRTGLESLFSSADYIPTSATQYASGMVREDLSDNGAKLPDWLGGSSLGQVAYDFTTTTANMLPSIMISFVPVVGQAAGAVTLGASAAGHAKAEMLNLGYTKRQANLYGAMVGASEAGLQYLLGGISKLGGVANKGFAEFVASKVDNAIARAAITLGASMASEGIEEALQTAIEPWLKSLATGVDWEAADLDEILYSGLLGAISSLGLEGVGAVTGSAAQSAERTAHGQSIIDAGGTDALKALALEMAGAKGSTNATRIGKLASKVDSKASAKNVGKLSEAIEKSIGKQDAADLQKALVDKGMSKSEARSVVDALTSGEELSAEMENKINSSREVAEAFDELRGVIGQRKINLMAARMGVDTKGTNATSSGELSLRNKVDVSKKVAEGGNAVKASTGEAVVIDKSNTIAKVAKVNGERVVYYNTDKGVVPSTDIEYASEDEGLLYESFSDMNPAFANSLIKNYDGSIPVMKYVNGMREGVILYGMHNFQGVGKDIRRDTYFSDLSEADQKFALELGREYAKMETEKAESNLRSAIKNAAEKAKAEGKTESAKGGSVRFDKGVDGTKLNRTQRRTVSLAKYLAKAIGIDIVFYDAITTTDKNGKKANGYFDSNDNSIHLDLQNAMSDSKTIVFTLSHELVHFIKKWSPQKFKTFSDFLMEQYAEHGVSTAALLERKMGQLGIEDADVAFEEMIADACERMLLDSNAAVKLMELRKADLDLFEKIKLHVAQLLTKLRDAFRGVDPNTDEGIALQKMEDVLGKIHEMFEDAAVDAAVNYNSIGARNLEDFSDAKTTNGEPLFQYKAMQADENAYRTMLAKWGKMTDSQIDNLFDTIDTAMDLIKDNLEVLDYAWEADIDDRAFSPVKPNSDKLYQVSLDFSTLCRKRLLQQTIQAQLQEALNQPLTKEEGIAIRDALIALQEEGRQIEVACALCYVESARMKSPEQIRRFLDNREGIIKEFFAGKSGGSVKAKIAKAEADARERLYKEHPSGIRGKDGKTILDPREAKLNQLPKKYADEIRAAKKEAKSSYVPTAEESRLISVANRMNVSDFTTPEGLENLAKNYRDLFDAYTSYVRNATKSKGIEADTWWRAGDSMQIGDVLIANMNRENGLRSQSWSDFQVVHILDYIAATIELATRNVKEQAYTKVPDFAELMGNTGVMINLSLIPTAQFSGNLEYDSAEGMDYKRSLELRDKYHSTVGTIAIGIDNKQIQMLLEDANIDYVIPYHKSGMSAAIRKAMHIPTWSQYEEYQSEKNLSRDEATKQATQRGVKLLNESDPNYQKHPSFSEWFDIKEAQQIAKMENANPSDKAKHKTYGVMYGGYMAMQNAANRYLNLCAERGISPKFSHEKADFTAEENYWKLLIDRKMVDNVTGEVIEQQTIKPIFDEGEIMRILNDELERYPKVKADQDYAIRRVTEKMLSGEVKGGMSAEAIAKAMKKPVDNVTNVNILASADELGGIKKQEKATHNVDADPFSYDALTSKPDMKITTVSGISPVNRADVVAAAKKNAAMVGRFNPQDGSVSVYVDDIGADVVLGTDGLKHGLRRNNNSQDRPNYVVTMKAGEIIKNSIFINEVTPVKAEASGGYILIGVARESNGDIYIVRSIVNRFNNKLESMDVLYAINAKKELAVLNAPRSTAKPLSVTNSEISIAQLLDFVNRYFPDAMPESVFKHYGHAERPKGDFSDSVLHQKKTATNRELLANTLESTAKEGAEKNALRNYKTNIKLIEAEEAKLAELRQKANGLRFKKNRTTEETKALKKLDGEARSVEARIRYYDKKLLSLESMGDIKRLINREKEKARREAEAKGRELVHQGVVGRQKTEMRNKIRKVARSLNSLLSHETKKRHVPEGLKNAVEKALGLADILFKGIDIQNEDLVRLGIDDVTVEKDLDAYKALLSEQESLVAELEKIYADENMEEDPLESIRELEGKIAGVRNKIRALDKKLENVFVRERAKANKLTVDTVVKLLADAYADIKESSDEYIKNAYKEEVHQRISALAKSLNGTVARDMDVYQLTEVYDAFKAIEHTVKRANEIFRDGRLESLSENVENTQWELREATTEKKDLGAIFEKFSSFVNGFTWNNLRPVDAFERLGSKTFEKLFWDFVDGMGVAARDIDEAGKVIAEAREKHGYSKWNMNLADKTYKTRDGYEFRPTLADKMSIYAYSKRQQSDGSNPSMKHMAEGGFTYDTGSTYKETENGKTFVRRKMTHTLRLSEAGIREVIASLTDEQKAYVDEVQAYLTKMGEKGNEASMVLYGIKLFRDLVYFPLQSSTDYRSMVEQELGAKQTAATLSGWGATKPTVPNARNPIVLRAFDDVVLEHVEKMSNYHGLVVPIDNLRRVFDNVSQTSDTEPQSTKAVIGALYGNEAQRYFQQWLTDINGGMMPSGASNPLMKLFSTAKKTAVAASLSVVAQQYSSIVRAMEVVDPKYFVPLLNREAKKSDMKQYDEMRKYAPIAIIKEMGGFDVGSKGRAKDFIGYEGARKDAKYIAKKIDDISMWGAEQMDKLGWSTIWMAIKAEVAAEQRLSVGSEEFYNACAKRFTEVVTKTQVYDSVASRSGYMRSQRDSVKFATSFMGEATAIAGRYFMAGVELARAIKSKDTARIASAIARVARTASVIAAASVLGNLAKALAYAGRDDDEDEAFLEKWARNFGEALAQDANPVNYVPFGRDIVSIIEGWDVERPDLTLVADLVTSTKKLVDGEVTGEDALGFVGAFGNSTGVPLKNIIREIRAAITFVDDLFVDEVGATNIGGAFKEGVSGKQKSKTDTLYDAILRGDDGRVKAIKGTYKTESAYLTAVRAALRDNDERIAEAAKARIAGDISKYARIVREIVAEGNFVQDIVVGAVNAEINAINKKADEQDGTGDEEAQKVSSIYQASDINAALESGDNATAVKIIEELIYTKVTNGAEEKSAKASVKSSITSYWKPLYKAAYKAGNTAEMLRIRKLLKESGLYGTTNDIIETCRGWLKD